MAKNQKPEDTVTTRVNILSPLLHEEQDTAKRTMLIRKISQNEGISERTLRRWLSSYKEEGFTGLIPKSRTSCTRQSSVTERIVDEAVILRREVPTRSIRQIIRILELEGVAAPNEIKRSTLQDQLQKRGYGYRQLVMYNSTGAGAARRFARIHRNDLWQADIKYLMVLPETATRPAQQLYASTFIDDATRSIMSCKVYIKQDVHCVLDCFRTAIEHNGRPSRIFTDNGSQYVSRHLNQVCAKLGIKHLRARPMAGQAKGKVEAFNKYLDRFVLEVKLKRPQSAAEVEHYLNIWISELYQHKPHSSLDGRTPDQAFKEDTQLLKFVTPADLNYAFTFTEKRLVDKTGCISFRSRLWEAGQDLIGMKVDVSFSSSNPDVIEVYHEGFEPRQIEPLVITEHSAPRKHIPVSRGPNPETSRELDAALKKYEQRIKTSKPAISFLNIMEEKNV